MNSLKAPDLVTVIGGSGFLGRQIVRRLSKEGFRIRVTSRNPNLAMSMRPLGDVGQIAFVRADILNEADVNRAVEGASVVVNLVGLLRPSAGASFADVHVQGARTVARAAARAGVTRLIHMSAIGAEATAKSAYARTKAQGESATREAFPGATILRPSVVFGPGDGFFNLFAGFLRAAPGIFPLFGGGRTKFQPVFVGDVAQAVAASIANERTRGKIFELAGPATYSLKELLAFIASTTGRKRTFFPFPQFLLELFAALSGWLPFAPITLDQARQLRKDNVVKAGPDSASVGTLADLGVSPTPLEAVAPSYLFAYRPAGQYSQPGVS